MRLNDFNVKAYSSCIRNVVFFDSIKGNISVIEENKHVKVGDLVLLKVLDSSCGYGSMETSENSIKSLTTNDLVIGVFGNRFSGTNVYGKLTKTNFKLGDMCFQLSMSGIVGDVAFVENSHKNKRATSFKIEGFLHDGEKFINIIDVNTIYNSTSQYSTKKKKNIFVFGTGAEVGKTTFVCNLVKSYNKNGCKAVSCAKVCGTGRLKDKNKYLESGCQFAIDYVDLGLPSTYSQSTKTIKDMIEKITKLSNEKADVCIYEVGGDMIEGGADKILEFAKSIKAVIYIVVGDAMGAMYAKLLLNPYKNYKIVAWKPNIKALSERLDEKVFNIDSLFEVEKMIRNENEMH